jgi:hypothetical protein
MTRIASPSRTLAVVLVATLASACAAEPTESAPVAPHVAEPVSVPASDETKQQLGVTVWGAESKDGALHIAGYGEDGNVAFVVDQRTILVDETHHSFETTLGGRESARMQLDATMSAVDATGHFEIALQTSTNTFLDSPRATSVLARIEHDLKVAAAPDAPTSTSLLSPKGVRPLTGNSLVTGCSPLLRQCAGSLAAAGAPLVPCAMALVQAGSILVCAVGGFFVGGPVGALEAGAVCGIRQQGAVVKNGMECAERSRDIYNGWSARQSAVTSSCGSAATSCTGGSGAAMSSISLVR